MTNERDELALAMRQNFSGWMGPSVSYDVADAILAAGYAKAERVWDEAYMLGFADCKVGAAPTRTNPHKVQP